MKKVLALLVFTVAPLLTLRWALPIAFATLRSEGAFDRTIFAFLTPVVLMLIGYPGYLIAAAGAWRRSRNVLPLRASVLLVLTASVLVLVWMAPAVLQMRSTLRNPWRNLGWVTPPLVSVACCVTLRRRLRRPEAAPLQVVEQITESPADGPPPDRKASGLR